MSNRLNNFFLYLIISQKKYKAKLNSLIKL